MKNKIILALTSIFAIFCFTSCALVNDKNVTEHFMIEYTDDEIDKNALETYFQNNEELYPSYNALKENAPNLLDNIKTIKSTNETISDFQLFRFSNDGNGFLSGETFLFDNNNYFHLGYASGGYGVTEFVRREDNLGKWLYFIYSYGSGIHRTNVGLYNISSNEFWYIEELDLELFKDYTFVVNEKDNAIDLYEATIESIKSDDRFDTYNIIKGDLAIEDIDNMKKSRINIPSTDDSSNGIYYGYEHSQVLKDYKEPTCQEEGYEIIGCSACNEIDVKTILPIVDCCYENGFCKWCGDEEH